MFDIGGPFMKQNAQDGKWNKSVATSTRFSLLDSFDMNSLWFKSRLYVQVFDVLMPIVYLFYEVEWETSFLKPLPDWNKLFISKELTGKKLGGVVTLFFFPCHALINI